MKKIYQTPSVEVTIMDAVQILAESLMKYDKGADADVVLTRDQKPHGFGNGLWEDMK